jgi:hypothetical protein
MEKTVDPEVATLAAATGSRDPEVGLRAVAALRGLLEVLEALQVDTPAPTVGPGRTSPAGSGSASRPSTRSTARAAAPGKRGSRDGADPTGGGRH